MKSKSLDNSELGIESRDSADIGTYINIFLLDCFSVFKKNQITLFNQVK
jgi:hypothetical protein